MTALTEDDIETFLSSLRAADVDRKVNLVQLWGIKMEQLTELPDRAIDAITLLVSPFIRSPSHLLVTSTLSGFLPYFLPLVPTSATQTHLRVAVLTFLPALMEKLNDPKDKIRDPARDCVCLLGIKCYQSDNGTATGPVKSKEKDSPSAIWESTVRDAAGSRGARVKLEILKILSRMRAESTAKLPLKPWLPNLVTLLEDSDGNVRDSARETVVELLSPPSTPAAARSELKKLMHARGVRKSISDNIIARVFGGVVVTPASTSVVDGTARQPSQRSSAPRCDNVSSTSEDIEVVYIANAKDLDNELRAMIPHFAGKETEHNWGPRELSLIRVRGMLKGNVFSDQPEAFLQGLRSGLTEGVAKTLLSLRTTVAQQSCALVQELAERLGPSFDPFLDQLLPNLGKMAGFTKRIIAEKSQKAVTAILIHSSPAPTKLVGYIASAIQEKSVQTRQYGAGHLRTYLEHQAKGHKGTVEGAPGIFELINNLLKKCLADTNPLVREQGRSAFWTFDSVWPNQSSTLMASLEGAVRKQLEKSNPHTGSTPMSSRISNVKTPRNSAMSALLAAKRAQAAELAAKRGANGEDPGQPVIETLAGDGSPRATPRSSSTVPSEGTVTPRKGAESPSPAPTTPTVLVPSASSPASALKSSDEAMPVPGKVDPQADGVVTEDVVRDSGKASTSSTSISETVSSQQLSSARERTERTAAIPDRPRTPRNISSESISRTAIEEGLRASAGSGDSVAAGQYSTRGHNRRSGIPIRSPPRNGSSLSPARPSPPPNASSPSSARPTPPRSSLVSPCSTGLIVSRTLSQTSSAKEDFGHPALQRIPHCETPPRALRSCGQTHSLRAQSPFGDARRVSGPHETGPSTPMLDHLPNSPADEQIRAQAAQAFSAAQQLLEFDEDEDPIADAPVTPHRPLGKPPQLSSARRTPSSGYRVATRQPWEDSPRPMTPKLLNVLQSRGYERSWWNERQKLLDRMGALTSYGTSPETVQTHVERLVSGEPSVLDLQTIALFSASHPVPTPIAESSDEVNDHVQHIWTRTRLFDGVFEGLANLLHPGLDPDILEQGLVTLWEVIQNQWPLCEDREDSLLDTLFQLRTSTNTIVLEATNALVHLLTEVCDPPFMLSLLHTALDRFLRTVGSSNNSSSTREVHGTRATAAGYSFGLNAMGMCVLHLPREAVEVEARQLAGPVMEALRLDSSSTIMARQAAHRVILAVQCVVADDVRTLALFPKLTPGQRSFATYLMQQNGVMGWAGDEAAADARRRAVLNELVGGLAKGARIQ